MQAAVVPDDLVDPRYETVIRMATEQAERRGHHYVGVEP